MYLSLCVQLFVFIFLEMGIDGSYGNSMLMFCFEATKLYHNSYTILHFQQQCMRGFNFPTSSPTLVIVPAFLNNSDLNG